MLTGERPPPCLRRPLHSGREIALYRQFGTLTGATEADMPTAISKRTFLAGIVCQRFGWLEHRASPAAPTAGDEWRFHFGNDIGARARLELGDGISLPRSPLDIALSASQQAVGDAAHSLLFEMTLVFADCVARADALRRTEKGWELIEVKSGKSPDNEPPKDEYIDDIAYTLFVAQSAGLPITRAVLMLIDRNYRLGMPGRLFVELDVTAEASARAGTFSKIAPDVTSAVLAEVAPEARLIFACKSCPHFGDCTGAGLDDHLFVIPRLSEKRFGELREYGRVSKLPVGTKFTDSQRRIVEVYQSGEPRIEPGGLAVLAETIWPAYYLDFEAVMPPLPWFTEAAPYEAAPFQYSLDRCDSLDGEPEHFEYLAPVDGDWRRDMTELLIAQLGHTGSIIVYSSYEKTRLNALAALFPDLKNKLDGLIARLFDLERVFKHGYCHPKFGGQTSIKKVLPVMVPSLTYANLPVGNGDDALAVFSLMRVGKYAPETHEAHRQNLLTYCALDTRAMVELHRAIAKFAT